MVKFIYNYIKFHKFAILPVISGTSRATVLFLALHFTCRHPSMYLILSLLIFGCFLKLYLVELDSFIYFVCHFAYRYGILRKSFGNHTAC
jgi:hypothetical protein